MKLKTFSPADDSFAAIAVGNRKADLAHDAAYAHALVMAFNEPNELDSYSWWGNERERLFTRTDELMREWGYS